MYTYAIVAFAQFSFLGLPGFTAVVVNSDHNTVLEAHGSNFQCDTCEEAAVMSGYNSYTPLQIAWTSTPPDAMSSEELYYFKVTTTDFDEFVPSSGDPYSVPQSVDGNGVAQNSVSFDPTYTTLIDLSVYNPDFHWSIVQSSYASGTINSECPWQIVHVDSGHNEIKYVRVTASDTLFPTAGAHDTNSPNVNKTVTVSG